MHMLIKNNLTGDEFVFFSTPLKQNISPLNGKQNICEEGKISIDKKKGKSDAGSVFLITKV